MVEPQSFYYGECKVYNLDDLIQYDKAYFYGCLKRKRDVLIKRDISEDDYFFARITKNGWVESNEKEFRAKILIKSEWVKTNVTKFVDKYGTTSKLNSPIRDVKPPLREAPPVLELEEHEKFCDDEGNVYEVEVRGVREEDKIYFKGSDVQKVFEMENLVKNIKRDHTNLEDYEQFSLLSPECNSVKPKYVKRTFFTTKGIRRILCTSRGVSPCKIENFLKNPFIKQLNINIDVVYLFKEQEILGSIEETFIEEDLVKQYSVKGYRIDLYFTEFKLAIECDEHNHKSRDKLYEETREREIKNMLNCTFIRFNPDDPDFKTSKLIRQITKFIYQQKIQELLQEKDARTIRPKVGCCQSPFGRLDINELNHQIELCQEREQEWNNEKREWNKREQEWNNEKREWNNEKKEWNNEKRELMNQNTMLLKQLNKM
jgi:very-short-patch-repair endonuclease